jgi:hypothetical protein
VRVYALSRVRRGGRGERNGAHARCHIGAFCVELGLCGTAWEGGGEGVNKAVFNTEGKVVCKDIRGCNLAS